MRAFISYTRADREFVAKLERALAAIDIQAVYDEVLLKSGDRWAEVLDGALLEADVVLFVLSEASYTARGVQSEISRALAADRRFIPLRLDDSPVPSYLAPFVWADFRGSFAEGFSQVEAALGAAAPNVAEAEGRKQLAQDSVIKELRDAYRSGQLTIVCGAGVSVGAGLPEWSELLRVLLARMFESRDPIANEPQMTADDLAGLFSETVKASPLVVGQYLKTAFGEELVGQLRDALYAGRPDSGSELVNAIAGLCRPGDGQSLRAIVSFNFDDVIEAALDRDGVKYTAVHADGERIAPGTVPIYHVHGYLPRAGDVEADRDVVFTEEAYHSQFAEPFSWSNLALLNELTQSTCLLLGLSVTDPNLRRLLDVARHKYQGIRHYVVLKQRDPFGDVSDRTQLLLRDRVTALEEQDLQRLGLGTLWVKDFDAIPGLVGSIGRV